MKRIDCQKYKNMCSHEIEKVDLHLHNGSGQRVSLRVATTSRNKVAERGIKDARISTDQIQGIIECERHYLKNENSGPSEASGSTAAAAASSSAAAAQAAALLWALLAFSIAGTVGCLTRKLSDVWGIVSKKEGARLSIAAACGFGRMVNRSGRG